MGIGIQHFCSRPNIISDKPHTNPTPGQVHLGLDFQSENRFTSPSTGECQQVLSAVSGNFSSPHFPNIYPNNINCHWSISLAAGYRIKLFFPFMDLEDRNSLSDRCDYDSVAVYDGAAQTDPLLGRWCGREKPRSLVSRGNKLLVVLSTDRNEAHQGFTASYLGGKGDQM
ncbi:CUB domain-containing protein 2-like [Synchiropus splendidus]|uniref:CUB domain-containing protein 2-like n=1 Tax=Synchiropus splendidus TaxID=270530 RepID=UPI00237D33B8|nr:CUB domain-containing protein 2-like [Synchiropus splendidus]